MIENTTIARPYANAAFEHAVGDNNLAAWAEFLQFLGLIAADPNMRVVLTDPKISSQTVIDMIVELCGKVITQQAMNNFIHIIVNAGRFIVADHIHQIFKAKKSAIEGIKDVEIGSAYVVDEQQIANLQAAISKRLGQTVSCHSHVDKDLIGGVVIRFGDMMIDLSLRGRLQKLRHELLQ